MLVLTDRPVDSSGVTSKETPQQSDRVPRLSIAAGCLLIGAAGVVLLATDWAGAPFLALTGLVYLGYGLSELRLDHGSAFGFISRAIGVLGLAMSAWGLFLVARADESGETLFGLVFAGAGAWVAAGTWKRAKDYEAH